MRLFFALFVATAFFTMTVSGCSSKTSETTKNPKADTEADHDHDHDGHAHGKADGKTDMEKMEAELAKLSPEDAASARKQHVCPVSGEMLGLMGPPIKASVQGQTVWLCCSGCEKKLLADPEKYLAELKE